MSGISAQRVIDLAQSRHPLLANSLTPVGAILKAMDARQRSLLVRYSGVVDGLVNTTVQINIGVGGLLVTEEDGVPVVGADGGDGWLQHETNDGVPYVDFTEPHFAFSNAITYPDGWAVHSTDDDVPYVDFDEIAIAHDPFGTRGGVPGFPLPADFLKLNLVTAVLADQTIQEVLVVSEKVRLERQRPGRLVSFVSGNRLVPLRARASGNSGDAWGQSISALQLSYVAFPVLSSLTDTLLLPGVLHEALIAGLAELLAWGTPVMDRAERESFSRAARMAENDLGVFATDVTDTTPRVQFRR